jgi:hypothetical protein
MFHNVYADKPERNKRWHYASRRAFKTRAEADKAAVRHTSYQYKKYRPVRVAVVRVVSAR